MLPLAYLLMPMQAAGRLLKMDKTLITDKKQQY